LGQTIVADWGDILEITVTSHLTSNGTGIHWHGLRQLGSNEMDGVNGLTEWVTSMYEPHLRHTLTSYVYIIGAPSRLAKPERTASKPRNMARL
jgi:hypothetical protein